MARYALTFLLLLAPAALAGPKLYVFDCGRVEMESMAMFGLEEGDTDVRELFVPCYLVRHDTRLALVDLGPGVLRRLAQAGYSLHDLDDVLLGSLGGVYMPNDDTSLGLIYDYRESSLISSDAISELCAFAARQLDDRWSVQFYAFTGFSDSSADWGAGIQFELAP